MCCSPPEKEAVVHRKRQPAGAREQDPFGAGARQQRDAAQCVGGEEDGRGDHEPEAGKRQRRQVAQTHLDEQPGRPPDEAEHEENADQPHRGRRRGEAHRVGDVFGRGHGVAKLHRFSPAVERPLGLW